MYSDYVSTGLFSFVVGLLLAMIPAYIAKRKGRNFWLWLVYGFFLWIIALIHAALLKEPEPEQYYQKTTTDYNHLAASSEQVKRNIAVTSGKTTKRVAHFESRGVDEIICPICQKKQKPDRNSCYSCGCQFLYGAIDNETDEETLPDLENELYISYDAALSNDNYSENIANSSPEGPRTRYCRRCGEQLPTLDSLFCDKCGTKVEIRAGS
jgi:hypothetical protein